MKKTVTPSLLAAAFLLCASGVYAQSTFRIGPKVGYNRSSGRFEYPNNDYLKVTNHARSGVEAGIVAQIGLSDHWAVQPAVLYAQRGFSFVEDAYDAPYNYTYRGEYNFRFNYLAVPINGMFSTQPDGQGLQVFGGPYVGFLLGGEYSSSQAGRYGSGTSRSASSQGSVEAGDTYTNSPDAPYVSRGVDFGLQGGIGCGFATGLQLQASYSHGLRNLGAAYAPGTRTAKPPTYGNYAFQLAVAYLFSLKN